MLHRCWEKQKVNDSRNRFKAISGLVNPRAFAERRLSEQYPYLILDYRVIVSQAVLVAVAVDEG